MVGKKQHDPKIATVSEEANDWFRQFLKHLEISMSDIGQRLPSDSTNVDFSRAALRAVKLTLRDSGLNDDQLLSLFGQVAFEPSSTWTKPEWTAELNRRRFELIDGDIQGTLTREERLELAGLTQIMREHVDSEHNLPFKGAQKLHRYLTGLGSEETGSVQ